MLFIFVLKTIFSISYPTFYAQVIFQLHVKGRKCYLLIDTYLSISFIMTMKVK